MPGRTLASICQEKVDCHWRRLQYSQRRIDWTSFWIAPFRDCCKKLTFIQWKHWTNYGFAAGRKPACHYLQTPYCRRRSHSNEPNVSCPPRWSPIWWVSCQCACISLLMLTLRRLIFFPCLVQFLYTRWWQHHRRTKHCRWKLNKDCDFAVKIICTSLLQRCCRNKTFLLYTKPISSSYHVMAHENLTHAVLCTDAYIVGTHQNNMDNTSTIFDVALPCGNHLLKNKQPILLCCLQYQTVHHLPHVPSGLYHIRAKVHTTHSWIVKCSLPVQVIPFVPAMFPTSPLLDDAAFALMGDLICVYLISFCFLTFIPLRSVLTAHISHAARLLHDVSFWRSDCQRSQRTFLLAPRTPRRM